MIEMTASDWFSNHARRLFEQAPAAIAVHEGPEHVCVYSNATFAALAGGRPLLGRKLRDALTELADQGVLEVLDRVYSATETARLDRRALALGRRSGPEERRFLDAIVQPWFDQRGNARGVAVFGVDVTELVRATEEVREESRRRDQFLAILGHELRNPLAPIFTALDLMRIEPEGPPADRARGIIERQARHLLRLIDDLMDVARVSRGRIELRRRRVDLGECVRSAVEMVNPLLDKRGHRLDLDLGCNLLVDADDERLGQVFGNLLRNAAEHSNPGTSIRVEARLEGDEVIASVRDDGPGIPPDEVPAIFEPFAQGSRARAGLGLGLALVKRLVELHGGTVSVNSGGSGRGSEFFVRLPACGAPVEPIRDPGSGRVERGGGGTRVLLVDDNMDSIELLREALGRRGYDTRCAGNGPAALELSRDFTPQVAVLDLGMPGMDGYELAHRLRQTPGLEQVPLVALTGYGGKAERERALAAGFDRHLIKPLRIRQILEVLAELSR